MPVAKLAIMIPTYRRPRVLQGVIDNIKETTKNSFEIYFGVEPEDKESYEWAMKTGANVVINKYEQGFANTIQTIYELTKEPFLFPTANDDFIFMENWDEVPMSMFDREDLMVVGMRQWDTDNHGSAIQLCRRKYIEEQSGVIDMPNRVLYPYHHCYCDTEFTQTAQYRGVWAKCDVHRINHMHPGLAHVLDHDETYRKNEAWVPADKRTYNSRKHLWGM